MLKKFNQLYNKVIFQSVQFQDRFVEQINNCDAFFRAYLQPLESKYSITITKQRYNAFRVCGKIKDVFSFLTNFKVDKQFCKDINGNSFIFQVSSPMICFGDIIHVYNNGEDTPLFDRTHSESHEPIDAGQKVNTTSQLNDELLTKVEGKWFRLFDNKETNQSIPDFYVDKEVHSCQPKELVKSIKRFLKSNKIEDFNDIVIYLEFMVNCDRLPNNCFGQMAKQVPITFSGYNNKILDVADKMNDTDKTIEPSAKCKLPESKQQPLVGETKKLLRKSKKTQYSKENKVKTKKVK